MAVVWEVLRWSERAHVRDRLVLLEDYDIALGGLLTSGRDLWPNVSARPREASGTRGRSERLHGGHELSVLDGWWPEGFDGTNGWSLGEGVELDDTAARDAHDAKSLYGLLEREALVTWADRTEGMPRRWL